MMAHVKRQQPSLPVESVPTRDNSHRHSSPGFTLIELVMAVAIISTAALTLLWMRTAAIQRVTEFSRARDVQEIAGRLMGEVVSGVAEELEGDVTALREGHWTGEFSNLGTTNAPLAACTVTITYLDAFDQEQSYSITEWISNLPNGSLGRAFLEDLGENTSSGGSAGF